MKFDFGCCNETIFMSIAFLNTRHEVVSWLILAIRKKGNTITLYFTPLVPPSVKNEGIHADNKIDCLQACFL